MHGAVQPPSLTDGILDVYGKYDFWAQFRASRETIFSPKIITKI